MIPDTLPRAAIERGAILPAASADLVVTVDESAVDLEWDAFVESTPGGHHAQTSVWARVKASLGWDAVRVIVREGDRIAGGVQLLTRRVGRLGSVAYGPRGPLLASNHPEVFGSALRTAMDVARARRIRYVKLQPPVDRPDLVLALEARGWATSAIEAAPTATVRVRLDRPEEDILAGMRRSTRRGTRRSVDCGLRIRVGGAKDVAGLHRVIEAAARRQGFEHYPRRYYETMWSAFAERDQALLLVGELDGQLLAAHLYLAFNDCITAKAGGWSGQRTTAVRPNAALDWAAMRWARERGLTSFDFDGISLPVARAIARGEEIAPAERGGVTDYKLGFGGAVMIFPPAFDSSPSRTLRPLVHAAAPRSKGLRSAAHHMLGRCH